MSMKILFTPSQTGSSDAVPLAYTGNPFHLLWSDVVLFFKHIKNVPGIILPAYPWPSKQLDEMYPSLMNMWTLALHTFLVIYQLLFIISIPFFALFWIPLPLFVVYCTAVFAFNKAVSWLLNGSAPFVDSKVNLSHDPKHDNESWVFLNGVAAGKHWLQANADRLALTFRRPVRGVHNPTDGIIFDLIQCLIERNFAYCTSDVRNAYTQIKSALLDKTHDKVVLILHSQGGIEGALIVDWLLDEIPQSLMQQLEIYTFGNAANHFNNPHRDVEGLGLDAEKSHNSALITEKAIKYIEHYGNSGDFVARWGILNFTKIANRYMGRIFERPGTGHLLNQHYMNHMFPLDDNMRCAQTNDFMEMEIDDGTAAASGTSAGSSASTSKPAMTNIPRDDNGAERETLLGSVVASLKPSDPGEAHVQDVNEGVQRVLRRPGLTPRVKDFSRLWQYRNGMSPVD